MTGGIADNIARLRERIGVAAERAGRRAEDVTLVAATKTQTPDAVRECLRAGLTDIGENYVQEALTKRNALLLPEREAARWHLLGHLQSNKARLAVPAFDVVQSLDSVRLAQTLARQAASVGKTLTVLLEVHLGDEETKFGLPPDGVADVAAEVGSLAGLDLHGLMGIAPSRTDPRPHFRLLRRLWEQLPAPNRRTLSMGMTGDFEAAIEEGATMVRVGTAIFGPRQ